MVERDFARAGRAAKRKGERGELEIRDMLREFGYTDARRNFASGGQGGSDLIEAIPDVALEVKRAEAPQFGAWWRQANRAAKPTDLVLVVHRGSNQPWQATGRLTDLHSLMQHMPMRPVIVSSNPRATFMHQYRDASLTARPMVLHRILSDVVATVLFVDFLKVWAPVSTEQAA
ncbi:MAG: hypothetical protein KGL39_38565 [Patescibacteria group bacterium]|nr:hypothetical protein [Patescibacteria group bacterium]